MHHVICAVCDCEFGMPEALAEAASCSKYINFYCPYGHRLKFYPEQSVKNEINKQMDNVIQLVVDNSEPKPDFKRMED